MFEYSTDDSTREDAAREDAAREDAASFRAVCWAKEDAAFFILGAR